jgi:hypothetical protein
MELLSLVDENQIVCGSMLLPANVTAEAVTAEEVALRTR